VDKVFYIEQGKGVVEPPKAKAATPKAKAKAKTVRKKQQ
jgi:hypothetical protein